MTAREVCSASSAAGSGSSWKSSTGAGAQPPPRSATSSPIRPAIPAVRGMLRLLEDKGYLRHEQDGPRYVYLATADRKNVSKSAVRDLVRTFFDDSASSAVAAMLGQYEGQFSEAELDRLERS